MVATVRAHLEQEGRIAEEVYVSNSDTDSDSASPQVDIFAAAYESRSTVKEMMIEFTSPECKTDEANNLPLSTSQIANEAEAEIPTAAQSSAVVISEAEAEASSVNNRKGIMTREDEERLLREKREKEEIRRKREEEEMADLKKAQERKTAMLLREQLIQQYAKQLDEMKVKLHAVSQVDEDDELARKLQEQLNKEEEEEKEKKRKEDAKFRISDSKLAKEMREEWIEALISQGEDADYLEKLSNKEIYRAVMDQQGKLAKKKRAEEEEKARQKSKKAIELNQRTHEERKVMTDFLKARGESGRRLGPMTFINLQALYRQVKKEEEERLGKKVFKTRVTEKEDKRPVKKQKTFAPDTTSTIQKPSTNIPKPSSPPPKKISGLKSSGGELKEAVYKSVDEVLQLPDLDLSRILEMGEAHEPANEGGKRLMLAIKHHFNSSKDVIINIKPLQSHSPFVSWSYNADLDEFTLTDVKKQQMRCSSKTIFKMPSKDIKTLSELPLNNPSKDPKGYEAYQQHSTLVATDRLISSIQHLLLLIGLSATFNTAFNRSVFRLILIFAADSPVP
ncbi:hypothetical protein L1987_13479 [Smallanthus sonchifolius]|uniref:Uncharacterized protein n=1 Tax=Smallanthus sonchifolius TaxID=185202 RepID=A0ACB9JGK3_9ASTR|nr:hypothetical protein L1987_13479 [Smallanthus sonchifolius]